MPAPLLFGLFLGVAQTVVTLMVYGFGLHSAPERIEFGMTVESLGGFVVLMLALVASLRSTQARLEPGAAMSYGRALRAGAATAVIGGLVAAGGQYVYGTVINPEFAETFFKALAGDQVFSPEDTARILEQIPGRIAIRNGISTTVFGTVMSLAIALFFRRTATRPTPPAESTGSEGSN